MIESAEEFYRLRTSQDHAEQGRARMEEVAPGVWAEVLRRYTEMRVSVVRNKTVPLAVLEMLATDPDPRVRAEVATKNKLSEGLFQMLARDADAMVRHSIACNKNVPEAVLSELMRDPSQLVARDARERSERDRLRSKPSR